MFSFWSSNTPADDAKGGGGAPSPTKGVLTPTRTLTPSGSKPGNSRQNSSTGKPPQAAAAKAKAAAPPSSGTTTDISPELVAPLQESLKHIVANSASHQDSPLRSVDAPEEHSTDALHSHGSASRTWISYFFPSTETLDRLFAYEHMGNYVIQRSTGKKYFEPMPLYVRVGMHLLFVSGAEFMSYKRIENLLEQQSIKQGQLYDQTGPDVRKHIESFIAAYSLPLEELLEKDLDKYPTFNSFFARRLVASARPITSPNDPTLLVSPSDCRLSVFDSVSTAKELWIKGEQFSIESLLLGEDKKDKNFDSIISEPECSIAICRLAPQDYHRFHSPAEAECIYRKDMKGELYTVNPQAINENLDVFTLNKRSSMLMHANLGPGREKTPMALVAVGAVLVGSIGWTKKPRDKVAKGEEMGWFQYGGSTVIAVFPSSAGVKFDADLMTTSQNQMETLIKVGMEMGTVGK